MIASSNSPVPLPLMEERKNICSKPKAVKFTCFQQPVVIINFIHYQKNGLGASAQQICHASSRLVMPVAASTIKMITLASSMAICTCLRISFSNTSSLPATKPPVSITLNDLPDHSATPYCRSRVTPLTSSTMAFRCFQHTVKKCAFAYIGPACYCYCKTHIVLAIDDDII